MYKTKVHLNISLIFSQFWTYASFFVDCSSSSSISPPSPGDPCSGLLGMLGNEAQTASHLNLVNSEVPGTDSPDGRRQSKKVKMSELVESLDMRELDMGEGEENDFDGNLGTFGEE